MKKLASLLAVVGLIMSMTMASAQTTIRPIEEFVDAQGTFCWPDGDPPPCDLFVPPIENFLGSSQPDPLICASVDYAGLADDWAGGAFGTTFSGHVVERPLADGRAMVTVNLMTQHALAWAVDGCNFAEGDLLFGHRALDVVGGAEGGFCDLFLQVEFTNTAPGAPLPDLMQIVSDTPGEGQELLSLGFRCNAEGPLPNGKWGMMNDKQTGIFFTQGGGSGVADGFPVEFIKFTEIKKGKNN